MKLVIGLVGEKGGGKETFGELLKKALPQKSITHVRFSDLLAQTLDLWSIPKTRANLQKLAVAMKNGFGLNSLPDALYEKITHLDSEIIIVDGVRWESDVKFIRSFKENLLIYVTTDLKIRYERIKKRNEKAFDDATSYEQFMKEEEAENELLIPEIGAKADYKINNDGSIADLEAQILEFIQKSKLA